MTTIDSAVPSGTKANRELREQIAARLVEARERTLRLVEPLSEADLVTQHDPLMSPIVWDLGHIAHFEELWLEQNLDGPIEFGELPGIYNPFEHPRRERGGLELPRRPVALAAMAEIRERVLARLATIDLENGDALLRDGYVYSMVLQHEYQHNETILQTLQLKTGAPYAAPRAYAVPAARTRPEPGSMVRFPGGRVRLGTDDRTAAYDNERPSHDVELAPFSIDVAPVTNAEYAEFIRGGGYARREWWSEPGWAWRAESGATAPKYWEEVGGAWQTRVMDQVGPPEPTAPVCHVCFYEAEAFARFAGKRLPTESEWETAAGWNVSEQRMQRFPWGDDPATHDRANIDQLTFSTGPVGAYDANWSPLGCYGMIGDVWEWTASDFRPFPGYSTFPYAEYSEVFFGSEYKVLRGGSWATRPGAIRNSFRNWDYPIRRQIFSGFRCARDD